MRTKITSLILIVFATCAMAQNIESTTRKFIDESQHTRINKDWNITAVFKSGLGEYVNFFPNRGYRP